MMKSRYALTLIAAMCVATAYAETPFMKGTNIVSAGIGFGGSFGGFNTSSESPGLNVQFERGIWPIDGPGVISLGGYAGYKTFKYTNQYTNLFTYNQKWTYIVIGVRSAYHYLGIKSDKFDVYGGFMLSYNILNYTYDDNNPTGVKFVNAGYGSTLGFSMFFGGRYFFTKNIAAQLELGFGVNILNLGVAFKI